MKPLTRYFQPASCIVKLVAFASFLFSMPCVAQNTVFYGMTSGGGSNGDGNIFYYNPATGTDSTVWSFGTVDGDGRLPVGNLVYNSTTKLFYALTPVGGVYNGGTIISFNPANNSEQVEWDFSFFNNDGIEPNGSLVYYPGNNLFYGTTAQGGDSSRGTIFTFNPVNDSEQVVWNFGAGTDGANPYGDVIFDAATDLFYGTTFAGGDSGNGTIFSFNPATREEQVACNCHLNGPYGTAPYGSLVHDPVNGLFYGMTKFGGTQNNGTIYSFNTSNNKFNMLWSLGTGNDGAVPWGSLVYDPANGLFYGMTVSGGVNSNGAIISFNPANNNEKIAWSFNYDGNNDGSMPFGSLVYDNATGLLYGMTSEGGIADEGTIISFDPSTGTDNVLWSFGNGDDGYQPQGDLLIYPAINTGIPSLTDTTSVDIFPNPCYSAFSITGLTAGQTAEIFNDLGQKIKDFKATGSTQQLNISSQPGGIYFVQIINGDGALTGEKKLVKE